MKKEILSSPKNESPKIKEAISTVKFMNTRIKQELKENKVQKAP